MHIDVLVVLSLLCVCVHACGLNDGFEQQSQVSPREGLKGRWSRSAAVFAPWQPEARARESHQRKALQTCGGRASETLRRDPVRVQS